MAFVRNLIKSHEGKMRLIGILVLVVSCFVFSYPVVQADSPSGTEALIGSWSGLANYEGSTADLALRFSKNDKGQVIATFDMLKTNIQNIPVGEVTAENGGYKAGPFHFQLNETEKTLTGDMSKRKIAFELKKDAPGATPSKLGPPVKMGEVVWTFPTKAPIWSSPTVQDKTVFFGTTEGNIHALETKSGKPLWEFKTGGPLYGRPTVNEKFLYMLSDDGNLYKLTANSGKEVWRFDTGGGPIKRSPAGLKEEDQYDYFTSGASINNGVVFIGAANNKLFALDDQTGKEKWHFDAGGIIRSTPAIGEGLVFFGSWDHFVYAVDEKTGSLKWKYDTGAEVTPSPVYANGTVYIGSRSADVFAFDASTGNVKWKYFYWFSWVESTGAIYDNVLYVGSSDYELLNALDTTTGKLVWSFDTDGSPWSSPAVTADTVFIGTAGSVGYMTDHRGAFFAVNRTDGKEKWRMKWDPIPGVFNYGVASSPAVSAGLVFFGGLDGKFYAVKAQG
jgi:outer membrane protein assembly factor BamB